MYWQVSDRRSEYNKLKQINEEEEDKLQAELKALQMQLEEKRLENRSKEGLLEREIAEKMNTIQALRKSIQSKEEELNDPPALTSSLSLTSFPPSAPGRESPPQYESLYSGLAASLSQETETDSPQQCGGSHEADCATLPSQAWLGPRSNLAKSLENVATVPVTAVKERKKYSRWS